MRVFIEDSGRRVAPFDDSPDQCLILHVTLADWREKAFKEAGLKRIFTKEAPCLVIPDTLFTTGEQLKRFVEGANGRDAVLVLANSVFGEQTTMAQPFVDRVENGWRFNKVRMLIAGAEPVEVVVEPDENLLEFDVPQYYLGSDKIQIPQAKNPIIEIHHWIHLLAANRAAGAMTERRISIWRGAWRLLGALFKARSLNKWRLLGKLNNIGKRCDIHPTALIEGSCLGDGVTVGPFARVMFSNVADRAVVMAGAQVEMSVIGQAAVVCQQCVVRASVLYPEAVASMTAIQQSILGNRVVTAVGSVPMDLNFKADVRVELDGKLYSSETRVLGCAIGHRCVIGSGVWIASGRAIPSDTFLIRDPNNVLQRPGAESPRDIVTIREGHLELVSQ